MGKSISVIIPTYNIGAYIERCAASVTSQTYDDLEIIIVDDGSSDDTLEKCRELERSDGRIKVITQQNGGVSKARNTGLMNASGEYIAFVDGDDIIAPFCLESLVSGLNGSAASMCMHERITCYEHSFERKNDDYKVYSAAECAKRLISGTFSVSACAVLFRRSLIGALTFPEGIKNNEDKLFLYGFLLQNENAAISVSDSKMYGYFVREGSASKAAWSGSLDVIKVADTMFDMTVSSHDNWTELANANRISARLATIKSILLSKNSGLFIETARTIRRDTLALGFPKVAGRRTKTEYLTLKLGLVFYRLLTKAYYSIFSDKARFKANEKQIAKKS